MDWNESFLPGSIRKKETQAQYTFKNLPKLSNDGKIDFNVAFLVFLE